MGAWIETTVGRWIMPRKMSHPSWVRGLKRPRKENILRPRIVAPFMGAWIETIGTHRRTKLWRVAPFMGAWIETALAWYTLPDSQVAPFMGAWMKYPELRITLNYRKLHYHVRESKMAKRMPSLHQ